MSDKKKKKPASRLVREPGAGKGGELPRKPISDRDAKAVKGGTAGVKKTMSTQV